MQFNGATSFLNSLPIWRMKEGAYRCVILQSLFSATALSTRVSTLSIVVVFGSGVRAEQFDRCNRCGVDVRDEASTTSDGTVSREFTNFLRCTADLGVRSERVSTLGDDSKTRIAASAIVPIAALFDDFPDGVSIRLSLKASKLLAAGVGGRSFGPMRLAAAKLLVGFVRCRRRASSSLVAFSVVKPRRAVVVGEGLSIDNIFLK